MQLLLSLLEHTLISPWMQKSVHCLDPQTARPPWSREALSERCKPLVAQRKGRKPARGAVGRRCVQDASAKQVEVWADQGLNPERSDGPKALRTSAGICSRQLENPTAALSSVTRALGKAEECTLPRASDGSPTMEQGSPVRRDANHLWLSAKAGNQQEIITV